MKMVVKDQQNNKGSSPNGGQVVQRKSLFGRYSEVEMLAQLKGLALDPCDSQLSKDKIRPLWNQTLRVRQLMALGDTEFPRRKRKLHQFLIDKFRAAPELASEVSNQQNVTKLNRGQLTHASSISSLINSVDSITSLNQKIILNSHSSGSLLTFDDDFQGKQLSSQFSFMDYTTDWVPPDKDVPFVDSDQSVYGSNPLSPENLTIQDSPPLEFGDSVHSSSSLDLESRQRLLQTPRRSTRLLNFIGDHLQRVAIPVGPRFQADVPDWTDPTKKEIHKSEDGDPETSRWLGTRVWPKEDTSKKSSLKKIGKGGLVSCTCVSPGSTVCINLHILERRFYLQYELGPAFFSWKFDEMGEVVSKSWTLKEQQSFESIMKICWRSNGKNFLKQALKCFPCKSRRSILSYYLNVSIPRRMGIQTRSSLEQVDDDDDDKVENINYLNLRGRCKGSSADVGSPKDVKSRYLLRPS